MTHARLWLSLGWWYYGKAIKELGRNYFYLLVFLKNFFSLPILARTLGAPFRRLGEHQPFRLANWQEWCSSLIVTTLMRLVGFVVRLIVIIAGVLALSASVFLFILVFCLWLVLPFLLLLTFFIGLRLIFSR